MHLVVDGHAVALKFETSRGEPAVQLIPISTDTGVRLQYVTVQDGGVPWIDANHAAVATNLTVDISRLPSDQPVFDGVSFFSRAASTVRSGETRVSLDEAAARDWGLQSAVERPTTPPRVRPSEVALTEIMKLDYADRWAEAERYRARASTAFTISTTVAGVLGLTAVLAGLFVNPSGVPDVVLWVGAATFALWAAAAIVALYAAAAAVPPPDLDVAGGDVLTPSMYGKKTIERLTAVQAELRKRTQTAVLTIGVALLATVAFLVTSLGVPRETDWDTARLTLTSEGETAFEELCQVQFSPVDVEVEESTTDDDVVHIRFPAGTCQEERVEAAVPQEDIDGYFWIP